MPRQAVVGIIAHVDAGKSTLAEAMLLEAGAIRAAGRVDHGDSHFDTAANERARGITIRNKQATISRGGTRLMLVDTPGHADFATEAERAISVLDYAVLVVAANDGVRGRTEFLARMLARYHVPTILFINKVDLAGADPAALADQAAKKLGEGVIPFEELLTEEGCERAAMTDEAALEEFLGEGTLAQETIRRLVLEGKVMPLFFGSALKGVGVTELLDGIAWCVCERQWPGDFAARVYGVSRGKKGERITWLKVTGGVLEPRMSVFSGGEEIGKVAELRIYQGDRYELANCVEAGQVCGVTGLSGAVPGDALGSEAVAKPPMLEAITEHAVLAEDGKVRDTHKALLELSEEDPALCVRWDEESQTSQLRLMGQVQLEVVQSELADRFGLSVEFGPGAIVYKETIKAPVRGVGHFEPLRHYAETHLLLEPLERGAGVEFGTICGEDSLDRNWQRLILTNAMEREHKGVLAGGGLTDVRITLLAGRAHAKHTVGGDFRQATYRAIRQALMSAESILLEPWLSFEIAVPSDKVGRVLSDLSTMAAEFGAPELMADLSVVAGIVPASEVQGYAEKVAAFTAGQGSVVLESAGYRPCHNADEVISQKAYEPEADLPHTPDSVFCSHGAGFTVKWNEVPDHAHVNPDEVDTRPWRKADASFFAKGK